MILLVKQKIKFWKQYGPEFLSRTASRWYKDKSTVNKLVIIMVIDITVPSSKPKLTSTILLSTVDSGGAYFFPGLVKLMRWFNLNNK